MSHLSQLYVVVGISLTTPTSVPSTLSVPISENAISPQVSHLELFSTPAAAADYVRILSPQLPQETLRIFAVQLDVLSTPLEDQLMEIMLSRAVDTSRPLSTMNTSLQHSSPEYYSPPAST